VVWGWIAPANLRAPWPGDARLPPDAPGGWQAGDTWTTNRQLEFLGTHDGRTLVVSFAKIRDATLRRRIVDLVERLAVTGKRRGGRQDRK
jgi:hypothetical protein